MKELYVFNFWYLFLSIVLLYLVVTYLTNTYIYTDSFYYQMLSDKFDSDRVMEIIHSQVRFQYIGYLVLPVVILLKLVIIAGVLYIGLFLFDGHSQYKHCLNVVLVAELVSVVVVIIRTGWMLVYRPQNANDIQYFSPLSLTQLLNLDKIPKYLFYPLQLCNVFEVAYWLLLAYGIMAFTNWKFGKSMRLVASSYGIALAVWAVVVVFIQVQFS
ncbi:MAG: hypothetical protein QM610_00560 [Chitinophagaceae bacterium]